jgi:hypothetical protein
MPRRKAYIINEELGHGLFNRITERIAPDTPYVLPIEYLVQTEHILIDAVLQDIEYFAVQAELFFETRNTTKLMQEIKEQSPRIQQWTLIFATQYKEFALDLNRRLKYLYNMDPRLLYYIINQIEERFQRLYYYDFSVISRLLSMILGKKYVLNTIPSTLSTIYTKWK